MYNLIEQKRVRFSDPQQGESSNTTERSTLSQIESFTAFVGDKVQNWFQKQFAEHHSQDYDSHDGEHAAAVAVTAFAIYSVEKAEAEYRRKMREELKISRTKLKSRKEDTITSGLSSKDLRNGGETSARKSADVDRRAQANALALRTPSRLPSALDQRNKGIPPRHKKVETKAEAWERAQMEKVNKRSEKIKAAALAWENERKLQARLRMEKKKGELDQRRALNQQHYQNKIARIEHIARGARAQADKERRNKEAEIKQKAKMMRSRGNVPVKYCFCC